MAFGNVLGFSSGAIEGWHRWFPFLMTNNCCEACANLKGAFLSSVVFLSLCLTVTLICAKEISFFEMYHTCSEPENSGFFSVLKAFKRLPAGMPSVVIVTSLTWLAWFPFLLYGTDWMGREIFHGDPKGSKAEVEAYNQGVQKGAFGLLLNSIVLGISAMFLEPICRKFTSRVVWVMGNFTLCIAMAIVTIPNMVSSKVNNDRMSTMVGELDGGTIGALVIFAVLGFPLAILFSIPFISALQLDMNEGGNSQGLCIGILNVSIVVPQVIVALLAGPWDATFGSGNIPAFAVSSVVALLGGFVALAVLPKPA